MKVPTKNFIGELVKYPDYNSKECIFQEPTDDYNSTMNFNYDTPGYVKDNHVKSRELLREFEQELKLMIIDSITPMMNLIPGK